MHWYLIKLLLTAGLVVVVSEVAKKNALMGSLVASLPLVSVLGMLWLYGETRDVERLAAHAEGTFWYVLPSLPMFLLVPLLLRKGLEFHLALVAGIVLTVILYLGMTKALARFGVNL